MNDVLQRVHDILLQRKSATAENSYVASLYQKGIPIIAKKVGEEATETVMAAVQGDVDQVIYETADLWFHTLVLLAYLEKSPEDVLAELERRFGTSGLTEKSQRQT
ncbi:MAG TPA: phosphoribosyl-ATP diphosphatase [Gammaproteobacteria bacterium]|nr:phosphoribosyl-ATP diphosphatase [Gammaproteobacteria bacterium]